MLLLSHPTGNENVRQAALALEEGALLEEFWTGVSWNPRSAVNRLLPAGLRRQLARRALPEAVRSRVRHAPWPELGRLAAAQLGWNSLLRHETGRCCIDAVYRALDRRVAARLATASGLLRGVYAYEDAAAATFTAAARLGLKRIYDLPIGYWRVGQEIYREEAAREPEWAGTLSGTLDSPEKLARKDEELRLADAVVVASTFTRQTLAAAPEPTPRVYVIPYGGPSPALRVPERTKGSALRILFAGSLGQRKGLSYLLRAVEMAGPRVTLTLLGARTSEDCAPLDEALRQHHWIPTLPHAEVLAEMHRHDVLVFPSLFEGFGLVILEAMSQGLPVITTEHTAGPDLLREGHDGFLVPIRSAEAIAARLDQLASQPDLLRDMQEAALRSAAERSWPRYRQGLREVVHALWQPACP